MKSWDSLLLTQKIFVKLVIFTLSFGFIALYVTQGKESMGRVWLWLYCLSYYINTLCFAQISSLYICRC